MISSIVVIVSLAVSSTSSLSSPLITNNRISKMMNLDSYLSRIGLTHLSQEDEDSSNISTSTRTPKTDRETLALIMDGQSRSIAFENFDVVMGKTISMQASDVEKKLVDDMRGGYCWELNTLLKIALEEIGFEVKPLMCRVRWGKPDDSLEPNTGFTHFALKVTTAGDDGDTPPSHFLADVGFAGTNSMEPISLDVGDAPQELPEGQFRVTPSKHKDFHVLELLMKDEWRPLYEWRDEKAPLVDQECSNWFSCTYPTARFTTQLFTCRVVEDERHHILNNEYVIRKGHGVEKEVVKEIIRDKARLLKLIDEVFKVKLPETDGIDRYLN